MSFCCNNDKILKSVEQPNKLIIRQNTLIEHSTVNKLLSIPQSANIELCEMVPQSATEEKIEESPKLEQILKVEPIQVKLMSSPEQKVSKLKGTIFFPNEGYQESPELSSDDIVKIQNNLELIKEYNEKLIKAKEIVLQAALPILIDKAMSGTDSKTEWQKNVLNIASIVCAVVAAASFVAPPVAAAFAGTSAILSTTAQFLGSHKEAEDITGQDLSAVTGYQVEFNNTIIILTNKMLDYFKDHVNENRDAVFKVNDKEYKLRDFAHNDFQKGTVWDDSITLAQRVYRNYFVTKQLAREQVLDLYFIQDMIVWRNGSDSHYDIKVEHGHCFQPGAAPNPPGTQRSIGYNLDYLGKDKVIMDNSAFTHFNKKQYCDFDVRGNAENNDQLKDSYLNAMKEFIQRMPPAMIYPWTITDQSISWQRYYIVLGKPKLRDDANDPNYDVPNNDFMYWLFIDDGFGNIVNPNGVGFRYDILRSRGNLGTESDIFLHGQQIGNETDVNDSKYQFVGINLRGNVICSSGDFRYGPKESAQLNQQYHVYTGDLFKN